VSDAIAYENSDSAAMPTDILEFCHDATCADGKCSPTSLTTATQTKALMWNGNYTFSSDMTLDGTTSWTNVMFSTSAMTSALWSGNTNTALGTACDTDYTDTPSVMFGDALELTCSPYYVQWWLNDNVHNGIPAFPFCSFDAWTSDPYDLLTAYDDSSLGGGILGLGNYKNADLSLTNQTTSFMWQYENY